MRQLKAFPYRHILVLGLAKSGTAAAELLLDHQLHVRVNDYGASENDLIVQQLLAKGAEVVVGSHPLSVLDGIDLIVKNPGISYDNIIISRAIEQNIPVITEIELAANLASGNPIIGITGSNGKTTTTTLVEEMLLKSYRPVKLAGNIGVVATETARNLKEDDALLLELSSFQLMGVQHFRPFISAILNLHGAHLDYHGTLENYMKAKANICLNQTADDYFVYNADDERVLKIVDMTKAQPIPFSLTQKLYDGAYISDGTIYFKEEAVISIDEIVLVGNHNLENILAAISIASLMGATVDGMKQVLRTFSGVKHRLQFVTSFNNREFYNDSKATNILATKKALASFRAPTILLAGGLDRGDTFESLIPSLEHVKLMVVFGETKEILKKVANQLGIKVLLAEDVRDAVTLAYTSSKEGDVILLSPACASWDQYKTFEERGDMFINSVHTLA